MNQDDEIIESLIAGGLIGAALGALLTNGKKEAATLGAIAGAALLATYRANEQAKAANIPVWVEENNKIYEIMPGGEKRFIKELPTLGTRLKKHYKLKRNVH
jgi:outer membrane lipoprotein SlyB